MMDKAEKIEAFYLKEQPFKDGIDLLRRLAKKTELEETLKWGAPVYTIKNKNVLGIMAFKEHFGLWFFNGVFLKDPKGVLENAQEGKTKAMRHWKFKNIEEVNEKDVLEYMQEAIANQKKGMVLQKEKSSNLAIPVLLKEALESNREAKIQFQSLTPYKQKEYYEYISSAKQEKTKLTRLEKSLDLILKGIGLNDSYRK
ncbi:YdeI/OmpD-associated family protein [Sediminicola sp. 1XM1-17]|uniref:YdeI/OmpD-associated family protein n=1 Tax=Sediminicola sp. 1XM1-17 TaxID=3127702 RepID=UPI003076D33D